GTDNALVGPMLAELLGYPQINVVTHLEAGEGKVTAHREIEGAEEIIEASLTPTSSVNAWSSSSSSCPPKRAAAARSTAPIPPPRRARSSNTSKGRRR